MPADRPFRCDLCPKDFMCKGHLVSHRRSHTNTKQQFQSGQFTKDHGTNASFMLKHLMKQENVSEMIGLHQPHPMPQHSVSVGTQVGLPVLPPPPNLHLPPPTAASLLAAVT
jgi:KRAB domain-containing zinc finger protein